jgi:hypothetical protein
MRHDREGYRKEDQHEGRGKKLEDELHMIHLLSSLKKIRNSVISP